MISIRHLRCRSNRILTFIRFTESISIIIVDERLDYCRRAYLVWISGNVVVRDKLVRVHSAGNIGIVVQVIFQQIFVFRAVYHIIRLCIGEGLDAEIVQAAISDRRILFLLFFQLCCCHCRFGIIFLPGKDLHHITLGRRIIIDLSVIKRRLFGQFCLCILVVQFPLHGLFTIFRVIRGIA